MLAEEEEANIHPINWSPTDVGKWAAKQNLSANAQQCLQIEEIDGAVLLSLTEEDIRTFRVFYKRTISFSEMKKLWIAVHALQQRYSTNSNTTAACKLGQLPDSSESMNCKLQQDTITSTFTPVSLSATSRCVCHSQCQHNFSTHPTTTTTTMLGSTATTTAAAPPPTTTTTTCHCIGGDNTSSSLPPYASIDSESFSPPMSVDGRATNIPPEFFKTAISLGYSFLVTWITSFVMVIVHERVPDMKRYPPLPDIFLDNVPHIPWAFNMCEITGTLLFTIWACVCILHKYRMVLLRRFFALAGTVFLLRCVTMLITSLSVPGTHLQCNQNDYAIDDTELTTSEAIQQRISRAYTIWSGLGMSIQGVRTCGDYMFSGHTVALTLLNFFITEYTPRNLYFLHTLSWLLNMFGIFFILAAHEHYSIDVFVAFYITSRLFLYYHTLANNQALMSRDSNRTRIWFPMFSYFESSVDGIIPNEYDNFGTLLDSLWHCVLEIKDACMLTARRYWINTPNITSKNLLFMPNNNSATTATSAAPVAAKQRHAATSTNSSVVFNTSTTTNNTTNTPTTTATHVNASISSVGAHPEDVASNQLNALKEMARGSNVVASAVSASSNLISKKNI